MNAQAAQSLLDFAEGSRLGLQGLDSKAVFAQLDQRYEHLLSTLQWFIA